MSEMYLRMIFPNLLCRPLNYADPFLPGSSVRRIRSLGRDLRDLRQRTENVVDMIVDPEMPAIFKPYEPAVGD